MSDELEHLKPQLPPPPPTVDADDTDEDEAEPVDISKLVVPSKGHTKRQAQQALRRFQKKHIGMMGFGHLADFGKFIKHKGTDATGIGILVFSANAAKEGMESCDELIGAVDDPELKVRLQENKKEYVDTLVKCGQALTKAEDHKSAPTDNRPATPTFPPNVAVAVQTIVNPEPKTVNS